MASFARHLRRRRFGAAAFLACGLCALTPFPAGAAEIKIGLILPLSGTQALFGQIMLHAANLYVKEHGSSIDGDTVTLVVRDDGGGVPEVAKRLAQELVVRDHVSILAGFLATPTALAAASVATEANVPMVVMNAGASCVTEASPNIVRVSFTQWQLQLPLSRWAATQGNFKTAMITVSDYAPGLDAASAFTKGFAEGGGQIADTVKMPVDTSDYTPFLQRVKDRKPQAVFVFLGGVPADSYLKAYRDLGMRQAGITPMGDGGLTEENELAALGDIAEGIVTAMHYSDAHASKENEAFVKAWHAAYGKDDRPNYVAVDVWDGMSAIYDVARRLHGKEITGTTAVAALKGWKSESPRGPIAIDPDTRDIVQNIYIRRVERVRGRLENVEFATIPMMKDPGKELGLCKPRQ